MNYIKYVNIKQGTNSEKRYSNGNTLPLVTLPFGMNNFCPQTEGAKGGWYFHPSHRQIEGIRITHQPSPWMGDYGHFVLSPQSGSPFITEDERASGYRPEKSVFQPNYISIDFLRYRAKFELAPTERGGMFRVNWEGNETPRLAVIPFNYYTRMRLNPVARTLEGFTKAHSGGADDNFGIYFVITFNKDIDIERTVITDNKNSYSTGLEGEGVGIGINIAFKFEDTNFVEGRLGTSFISMEQAALNLEREVGSKNLETLIDEGKAKWNEFLGKVDVEMNSEEEMKTFYSCLYRSFIFPRAFYEYDKNNNIIHRCTKDGTIKEGYMYTDNGFWDTYRTVYPLFSILIPDKLKEMLQGFVNFYKEEGWLPRWISPGERGIMPGTLIDAVLADGAVKGILEGKYLEKALEGMLKHSNEPSGDFLHGRTGISDYLKYGYLPRELYKESVNNTLDNAYGDFCIAQVGELLGKTDLAQKYYIRSKNYRNVFDSDTGFCRGKDVNGEMKKDFNPLDWGGEYCEGGAWQNSFGVYHDITGLADLMGGRDKMIEKMDELFSMPPLYRVGAYGIEIHEMTEMAAVDFGQCAISNQPSFHLPYIYSILGKPESSAYWVRRMLSEAFDSSESGFPGDEDNGTTAAWYIFSALGFYPVCPGKPEYVVGSPLVKKAVINLNNGGRTVITATQNDNKHIYVGKIKVNGEERDKVYFEHDMIVSGSGINFEMMDVIKE